MDFLTIIKYRKKDINKIVRLIEKSCKRLEMFILILSDNNQKQKRQSIESVFRLSLHMFEFKGITTYKAGIDR